MSKDTAIDFSLQTQTRILSFFVVLLGGIVATGWVLDVSTLKTFLPNLPSMKANTSVSFILCGLSLWLTTSNDFRLLARKTSHLLISIAIAIATVTLAEYFLNWDSGLDGFFLNGAESEPERMSIMGAVMFLLSGVSLFLMTLRRHYKLIQFIALIIQLLALISFGGYLFGNLEIPLFSGFSGMAIHTAFGFVVLSIGIFFATAHYGWLAALLPYVRLISIVLAIAILFVSMIAMNLSTNQRHQAMDTVAQSYRLLNLSEGLTSASYEHKAINRSYLLTKNEHLLERTSQVRRIIGDKLITLKDLTSNRAEQQATLNDLTVKFDSLFSLADKLISVSQTQGLQSAAKIVEQGEIDHLHADIIRRLVDFDAIEQSFLQTQLKSVELKDSISKIAFGTVLLLGIGTMILTLNILNVEIKRRKESERLEKSRSNVLELIACGASLPTLLEAIVLGVETEYPAMRCSILLADETGKRLFHGAAPNLPDFYNQAINGIDIGFGVGSCGTAANTRQRVIVADIQNHPYWSNFKALAYKAGLAACWSEPIFSSEEKLLGTFAIYHPDIHHPSENHIALIEQTAKLASIAIEKHQTDLALKESEARYRILFEANPLPMWVFDAETLDFVAVDDAAIRHYGYNREEFLSMKVTDIRPVNERERLKSVVTKVDDSVCDYGIWKHITKDGREIWVEITAQLIMFEGRKAVITLANDVTERLRVEQQLYKLSMAVEQSPESILITDLNATIEYVNDAFTRNSGFSREESIGKNISFIQSKKTPVHIYQELWASLKAGQIWEGEFINRRKDGTEYDEFSIIAPVKDKQGVITHYAAIQEDVSEKKKLNAELAQHRHHLEQLVLQRTAELEEAKTAAEAANVAKSAFLSNMSHEIRSPMNAVLGFCYLLEHQDLPEESLCLVHKIHNSGKALLSIINDILDFSKIEAGRLEIENQPFKLNELIENIANFMSACAGSKNLELTVTPPLNVNSLVGDEMRLQQVLVNLLSNSVKFTEKGEIELNISVESEQDGKIYLRFSVRDTGIGISLEQQQSIFEAFSQADSSISRRFGGTGLGLAICQQLVAMMGGHLNIKSELGVGSEFWFVLPLERYSDETQNKIEVDHLRVLVVDDCETVRIALQRLISSFGWDVDAVGSGEASILQVLAKKDSPYDIILMDWKMPGVDGIETVRALRQVFAEQLSASKKLPIILMVTAYSQEALKAQPGINELDGLLNKPVTPSALYDAITKALGHSQPENVPILAEARDASTKRLDNLRILVVDDSEINREVARLILEREGALISEARDGQEALDWLSGNVGQVDVVLMDIQMPRLDGYAATRQLRWDQAFKELPVLALTAGAFKNLQDAALNAGMNDFISKPFNADLLIKKIQYWASCQKEFTGNTDFEPTTDHSAAIDIRELPGINLTRGLELWGEIDVYRHYISKFINQYARASSEIIQLVQVNDQKAVAAFAHKLKGSSSSLALDRVSQCCHEIEKSIEDLQSIIEAANALQQAIDEVAESLSKWGSELSQSDAYITSCANGTLNNERVKSTLNLLLASLDEDSPTNAKPLIHELETLLGNDVLADIKDSVFDFNFRKAEDLTRKLISRLQ